MDPEFLVSSVTSTVVTAMATDAWQSTRDLVVGWWRRTRPGRVDTVEAELEEARRELIAARQARDTATESDLVVEWTARFRRLLREDPELAQAMRQLLADEAGEGARADAGDVLQKVNVRDHGKAYVAGRDQHISGG
jgi:hypothetical protein